MGEIVFEVPVSWRRVWSYERSLRGMARASGVRIQIERRMSLIWGTLLVTAWSPDLAALDQCEAAIDEWLDL